MTPEVVPWGVLGRLLRVIQRDFERLFLRKDLVVVEREVHGIFLGDLQRDLEGLVLRGVLVVVGIEAHWLILVDAQAVQEMIRVKKKHLSSEYVKEALPLAAVTDPP